MKLRYVLITALFLINFGVMAQPPETIYLGNVAKVGYADDESYGPFSIGFNFTFYGNVYSQFYINSNGMINFGSSSIDETEDAIPAAGTPNNYIALFWDDLVVDGTGKILYTSIGAAPNRKLIVQFLNMGFYTNPVFMGTFTVILHETSNIIQIQYRQIVDNNSTRAHGISATIGIENSTGTAGVQYAYHNPTAIIPEQAISFTPSGPTYTVNSNATYDGVYLTTNLSLPGPGITNLVSPPENAVIGSDYTFEWASASYATSYSLFISTNSDLSGSTIYSAGSNLTYDITGLTIPATYYWGVFASNPTGTSWCTIQKFTTSPVPPLAAVPQTIYIGQGQEKFIKLQYTGGDASGKITVITSLPLQGQLYQYDGGIKGSLISSVPIAVSDPERNVIYVANGSTGNGAGNFNYMMHDDTGDSPEALITVNVSPPDIPNLLYTAKSTYIELQFDRPMADPTGKQNQFTATVNSTPATINSLNLKTGDLYSIIVNLATPLTGTETVNISYIAGDVSSAQGGWLLSFTDQLATLTAQTINFSQSLSKKYSDSPMALTATASSGLGMTYTSSNLSVATVSGNILTFLALGTSDITARQSGNATYAPAKYIKTLTVVKGDQVITFSALPSKTYGDADFNPGATVNSDLTISYTSDNTAVATIASGQIHIVGAGTAVITALQAGNSLWNPATDVNRTLSVSKANQIITFSSLPVKTYGNADFNPGATASSSLAVTYSSDNSAVATVVGGSIHITGGGTAVITASQSGNTNFNPAPDVTQTLTVNKTDLILTADNKTRGYLETNPTFTYTISGLVSGETQSVLDALPTIQTTALQNSPVGAYPITISGGNDNSYNYLYVPGILTITKIDQTITFTDVPDRLLVHASSTLVATSTSGLPVLFESMDTEIATVTVVTLTGVLKGSVQIRAYNNGDQNYNAAQTIATVEITSSHKNIMYLFTPNNDGFNDLWEIPEMNTYGKCDVRVFNRWGKLVFADDDYDNLWDGISNGNPLPEGAYYFVIKTQNSGTIAGTVNIVR